MTNATLNLSRRAFREIEISRINDPTNDVREKINQDRLNELTESLQEFNVLQSIVVTTRPAQKNFDLIIGGRRLRSARAAGIKKVPALIYDDISSQQAIPMALTENIHRDNLEPMEEARAFDLLRMEYGYSDEQIAREMLKPVQFVKNRLRLLGLPKDIQKKVEVGKIPVTTAIAISTVKDKDAQRQLAKKVEQGEISYAVANRLAKESEAEARRQKQLDRKRREKEKKKQADTKTPRWKPVAPIPSPKPPRPKAYPNALPIAKQDALVMSITERCEKLQKYLKRVDLKHFDDQHLRNLRGVIFATERDLNLFSRQISQHQNA